MYSLLRGSVRLSAGALRHFHRSGVLSDVHVKMPSLSPTMTAGTIVKWNKQEGDSVEPGDVLAEIQTDKAVVSLEIDDEGVLAKILVAADSGEVPCGQLIAILAESGEDWKNVKVPADVSSNASAAPSPSPPVPVAAAPSPPSPTQTTATGQTPHMIAPSANMLLHEYNLDASSLLATGPRGTLTKADVLAHVKSVMSGAGSKSVPQSSTPPPPAPSKQTIQQSPPPPAMTSSEDYVDIELSNMRKTIAKRLTESKQTIPHAYGTIGVRMNQVQDLRAQLKQDGHAVTVNDFIIKAAAAALVCEPGVNSQWKDGQVQWQPTVDISVAVATPNGLITPIVPNADHKGIATIGSTVRELAGRARENKLQLHEFQGGTFTVSNLGMMGISEFTAIINPPQAAILAIGGSLPCLTDYDNATFDHIMKVTLCYDVRVVSEVMAARWLQAFQNYLETPELLLCVDPHASLSMSSSSHKQTAIA